MIATSKINMDLLEPGSAPVVEVMQKDQYCRNLELTLFSGGEPWMIPEDASAVIRYRKTNGKGGEYDVLPDGDTAWWAVGNVLTVALAPHVTSKAGVVKLAVTLLEGKERLTSFSVMVHVQAAWWEAEGEDEDYLAIGGFLPAPSKGGVGQVFRISSINEKGQVTGIQAVDVEKLLEGEASDEELLAASYTLTEADFIHGLWNGALDAGSGEPYSKTDVGDQFCTRKIRSTLVPKMAYFNFTTPMEYVFWNNGAFAGKIAWSQLSKDWTVGFEFDEVAINFSWGWSYVGTEVIVRLSVAVAAFDKVLVLGDSISTDYYGNYPKWVTNLIDEGFLPANTTNDSIHATGFVAKYTAEGATDNDFLHRMEAVTGKDSYDLVVVFGGINDFIHNVPMGESGGDPAVSFVPAVEQGLSYLVNNFPQARIVTISPLRTYHGSANNQGHFQTEYAQVIRNAAKALCIPVLNLTEDSGFCPFNEVFKERWTLVPEGYTAADGVHPNEEYQKKFLAPQIRAFLQQFV